MRPTQARDPGEGFMRPQGRAVRQTARWSRVLGNWMSVGLVLTSLIVLPGCTLLATPSLQLVSPSCRKHHPWGPAANELRAQGLLPYRKCPPQLNDWAEFARQHIEDG